ncbi:hypothetical protein [Salirhabdus salicampi]|uniref:hypothetical protein n=1 Tax=Salirhabdus salicampi TaxID=476102 RepID=UPI0020C39BA6|nr:hypothetical protein [Salirhabdus salicampi]MCP8615423.1 hypothetical protein [Salirhabdus salicampi]
MKRHILLSLIFMFLLVIVLAACKNENQRDENHQNKFDDRKEEQEVLYDNDDFNLIVYETDSWNVDEEKKDEHKLIVSFQNEQSTAIITSVNTEKNFDEIKQELKTASGNVEIIQNSANQISFKSKRKSSIRTDIYLEKQDHHTYIYSFKTPVAKYDEAAAESINQFKTNITIN